MSLFAWFRRRSTAADSAETPDTFEDESAERDIPMTTGPWDVADQPEIGARVDLGSLRVPARPGMKLRMEADQSTRQVVAASLILGGSVLQLQAFAAPRRNGVWEELRREIAASVEKQGGTADEVDGPFGAELLARLPVRTKDGRSGHRPARFIGVDGPRWFLRGVLTGQAAISPDEAATLEEVFRDTVVVRGDSARPPREPLPLSVPRIAQQPGATAPGGTDGAPPAEPAVGT